MLLFGGFSFEMGLLIRDVAIGTVMSLSEVPKKRS